MATNFPTSKDTFTNPTANDKVDVLSHADQHANANDGIEALQTKVGINGDTNVDSLDYKLSDIASGDKAISSVGNQTITGNVTVTGTLTSEGLDAGAGDIETTGNVDGADITATGKVQANTFQLDNDVVELSEGGTGANLTAPTEDKVMFYDHSAGTTKYAELGTGIDITDDVISAGGSGATVVKTAGKDVEQGDVIGVDLLGEFTKSKGLYMNIDHTYAIQYNANYDTTIKIGDNKFVVISAYSSTLYCMVWDNGTWGSIQTFITDLNGADSFTWVQAVRVRDDVFAFQGNINLYTFSVSGTTITLEDTTAAGVGIENTTTSQSFNLEDDKAICVYNTAGTGVNDYIALVTWTGYVPTNHQSTTVVDGYWEKINSTKFARVNLTNIYITTVSGNTYTEQAAVSTTNTNDFLTLIDTNIVFTGDTATNIWQTYDVSGTTATLIDSGTDADTDLKDYEFRSSGLGTQVVLQTKIATDPIMIINHSAGSVSSIEKKTVTKHGFSSTQQFIDIEEGRVIASIIDTINVIEAQFNLSNNELGIAQNNALATEDVSILVNGVDSNQTGLIAGSLYKSEAGFLVEDNTDGEWLAISATEIKIK